MLQSDRALGSSRSASGELVASIRANVGDTECGGGDVARQPADRRAEDLAVDPCPDPRAASTGHGAHRRRLRALLRRSDSGREVPGGPGRRCLPVPRRSGFRPRRDRRIVTGTRPLPPTNRFLATVVFTDIVGSTVFAQRDGDARWRARSTPTTRWRDGSRRRFGGRIVDTAGDGALATFAGPTPGIQYARAFRDAVHELGVRVRVGVHTGEVEQRGSDLAGIGVHVGARVSALADADQVLVTSTVRELVLGSRSSFVDRGEHDLKGVEGSWHLYELAPDPVASA